MKHILRAVCETPWAIMPEKLDAITELLELRANGGALARADILARVGSREAPRARDAGGIAVLPLFGVIAHRMNLMTEISGGTSCEVFGQWFDAAVNDPGMSAVVLDVDSPGGTVEGVEELAAKIHAARGKKPIIAVANSLCASAAYWLAAACEEIVAIPAALVGAVGVFTVHTDVSQADAKAGIKRTVIRAGKHKAEDLSFTPLNDETRAARQEEVNEVYSAMVGAIAKYRGLSVGQVQEQYGQGRAFRARKALALGLVDRVAPMEAVLSKLGAAPPRAASRPRTTGTTFTITGPSHRRRPAA